MIVYDVATKVLDTEKFPQHTISGLNSGIAFVLFSLEKHLRWKELNTQTHIHTHTHTHTTLQQQQQIINKSKSKTEAATKGVL